MKIILLASLVLGMATVSAQAESFTFSGTNTTTSRVVVATSGSPSAALNATGEGKTTYASGKTETTKNVCSTQTRPPEDEFDSTGLCEVTDSGGDKFGATFACNTISEKQLTTMCWGMLVGTTGKYKDKTGSISWTAIGKEDQSGNSFQGGGSWID